MNDGKPFSGEDTIKICGLLPARERYAILFPSGDQTGLEQVSGSPVNCRVPEPSDRTT